MTTTPRLPRRLHGSATLGIVAPSGLVDVEAHARSVAYFQSRGHRVVVAPNVLSRWRYFAGTDEERLEGFHQLLADPAVDVIMAARGGYGWTRLLQRIDFAAVAATDKIIVGFSDLTAFSLAALASTGLITFAGPMAAVDFGNGNVSPFMEANFWPLLSASSHHTGRVTCTHGYPPQTIEGRIWGSSLSLVAHLVGTPYMPRIEDGILFLEDLAEQPYAVERMLYQLHHAGILQQQRALILADFDACTPATDRYPYSMEEVVESLRSLLTVPVLTGLPFGHVREKITLPIGGQARLNIDKDSYGLAFHAYNSN